MKDLVERLGCLPLAVVQAGRYMRETGTTNCTEYLQLYKTSWLDLQRENPQLRDYDNGNVQTTWMISYHTVRQRDETAANLLQLWAHFHYQDLWFELFHRSKDLDIPSWIKSLARSKIRFKCIMRILLAYSLVESSQNGESYSIHPVVHDWCRESISRNRIDLIVLALIILGFAVPDDSESAYWLVQRRLLPHANQCGQEVFRLDLAEVEREWEINDAFHSLGVLYHDQSKLVEAEKMYERALYGKQKTLSPDHISTLDTVDGLGGLYCEQEKLTEAEKMYQRALSGKEKSWGADHPSTLDTVNNLGTLYDKQGKLAEAEKMFLRALDGKEKAWGPDHSSTLTTVNNLGLHYVG